jgi:LuxR family quorum-sensing system transcriptional regulator CciR
MDISSGFKDFATRFNDVPDEASLRDLLIETTAALGFEQFALNHHVDLAGPPEDAISLMNYDSDWVEMAISKRFHIDDPIHAASTRTAIGFLWADVPRMLPLSRRQRDTLEAAKSFGLCEGFTVPIHVPGEYRGTCSFGARSLDRVPKQSLAAAQLVGAFAFEAARRIMRSRAGEIAIRTGIPRLSPRQLDCVVLVARGKGDWEISRLLNLSEATVHQHIGEACRRYDVAKRTQLVVRALFDGQITFNDTIRR